MPFVKQPVYLLPVTEKKNVREQEKSTSFFQNFNFFTSSSFGDFFLLTDEHSKHAYLHMPPILTVKKMDIHTMEFLL